VLCLCDDGFTTKSQMNPWVVSFVPFHKYTDDQTSLGTKLEDVIEGSKQLCLRKVEASHSVIREITGD
jgi:hypothetical protein